MSWHGSMPGAISCFWDSTCWSSPCPCLLTPVYPWLTRSQCAPNPQIRQGANALCSRHLYVTRRRIVNNPRPGLLKGCSLLVRFPGCPPRLGAVIAPQPPRLPALASTTSPCAITARRPPEPTTATASHSGADDRRPHRAPASPSRDRRPGLGSDARARTRSTRGDVKDHEISSGVIMVFPHL